MSTNYINQITDTGGTTHDIMEGVDTRIFRATCSTAASTAAKVATLDDATNYSLAAGVRVAVTFTYGNSAATPTLNVNSGGAKTIVTPTAVATLTSGNGTTYNTWGPYETVIFTYSGSYWVKGGTGYSTYNAYALANSKTDLTIGTTSTTAAAGNHTHTASLATSTGTSDITLTSGGKFQLTAGGDSVIFTMPSSGSTYSAGTGLSLSGSTFNHSNSVSAGTAGTSSATSGSTLAVPYVTYDAQGHVTASGTHTHTVTGFATANTYVTQTASTATGWRGVLGTFNTSSDAGTSPTGVTNISYYNGNVMFSPSNGIMYASGDYYMGLSTTDSLYTAINAAGWASDVIV